MERIPRAIYTKELREEAVKLVTEGGFSIPEVGRRLSVSPSTLRYWVKANREGKLKEVGKQQRPLTEIEMELARVKRELAEVRMERELLKKAAAYFAKESLPGRDHEGDAIHVLYRRHVPYSEDIKERLLPMAQAQAFPTCPRRGEARSGDKSRTPEDP
jgi:transposase